MRALRPLAQVLAMVAALCALLLPAAAQPVFPPLSGRVVDEAGILGAATRAALTDRLASLEAQTSDQLVVVTLKSLQGLTIEDFGVRLGRQWQIGQRGQNNGVLLIVAPHERKVRIEVGYGLEGVLTDAIAKLIIETTILPQFRDSDYPGGVARGVDAIIEILTGDAAEWQRRAQAARPAASMRVIGAIGRALSWIPDDILAVIGIVLFGFVMSLLSMIWLWIFLPALLHAGIWLGLVSPKRLLWLQHRQHAFHVLSMFDDSGSGSGSSFSWGSSGSSGFSGGGGSFGGGGSSGSW